MNIDGMPAVPSAPNSVAGPKLRSPVDHGRALFHGAMMFNGQPGVARLTSAGVTTSRTTPFLSVGGPLGGPQVDTANTTLSQWG